MDKRRVHRISVGILLVVIVAAGGAAVALALAGRGVLAGETHHDFGVVRLSEDGDRFEHTFRLTNRTDEVVEIDRIKTSCGCLASTPSTNTVEPGEAVEISVSLLIKASVRKRASLTILLGERGVQTLTVEALGRRAEPLFARRPTLEVPADGAARMNIYLEREESGPPPGITDITSPDGVEATLGAWTQSRAASAASEHPAIWLTPLEVRQTGDSLPVGAAVTIRMDDERIVTVPLESPVTGAEDLDDADPPGRR
ncbi:MAG: DUF1573 domain-containing protein [Planctomycetota bacterium]|jgi:hypothetical protein